MPERPRGWSGYGGAAIIALKGTFTQDPNVSRVRERTVPRRSFRISSSRIGARRKGAYGFGVYVPTA